MSYQVCPICKGTGIDESVVVCNVPQPKCTSCTGNKIINTVTGLPPKE